MTEHNVQRVAIAGFGAIGKVVAEHLDRGIDGLSLAAVSARDTKRAEAAMAGFAHPVSVLPLARLGEVAEIVDQRATGQHDQRAAGRESGLGDLAQQRGRGAFDDDIGDLAEPAERQYRHQVGKAGHRCFGAFRVARRDGGQR